MKTLSLLVLGLVSFLSLVQAEPQFAYYDGARIPKGAKHKTLRPAVHWDHDLSDLSNLVPSNSIGLYYTENGRARANMAHQFTHMDSDMEYPGVVLEHSRYVSKVVCHPGAMSVHFNARKAWSVVTDSWNKTGGFILVEHSSGCGEDKSGQKVYWLAKSVTFNHESMTALVHAKEIELENALAYVKLQFGMWQPHGRPAMLKDPAFDFADRAFASSSPYLKREPAFPGFKFKGNFKPAAVQVTPEASCGQPIAQGPGGLPTAACGTSFDEDLDNELGYMNFTSDAQFASSLKELAPNLDDYDESYYTQGPIEVGKPTAPPATTKRSPYELHRLEERGFFGAIGAWFARAAQAVVNFVKSAADIVADAVKAIAQAIGDAVTAVLEAIGRFIVQGIISIFGPDVSVNLPINAQAVSNADSTFGRATKIGSISKTNDNGTSASITFYCVRCGIHGDILFFGKFEFAPGASKLSVGQIGVMGSLMARVVLGLEGELRQSYKQKMPIVEVGLPGFSIPKVITIGPVATLSASASADIFVTGSIQAGAEVTAGPFASVINIVTGGQSGTQGFDLKYTPVFSVAARIDAYLRLGLPLSIGFGVVIPLLKFEKTAAIIDEPYASANLEYTVGDKHVNYKLFLGDRLTANLFDVTEYTIVDTPFLTIAQGQIPLPGTSKRSPRDVMQSETYVKRFVVGEDLERRDGGLHARQDSTTPLPPETPEQQSSDFPEVNKMALAEARMYEANPNGADVEKFGFSFQQIYDSTGNYHLTNENNGNFGLTKASTSNTSNGGLEFETYKGMVVSDYGLRLFHYYAAEMAQYQVSRFRLADPTKVPADSKIVILQPFDIEALMGKPASNVTNPLVYLAVDTERKIYFPITCSYNDNQPSKIFLAANSETGPTTLMDPDLQHTVTGGDVQECIFLPFVENGGPGDEFGTGASAPTR